MKFGVMVSMDEHAAITMHSLCMLIGLQATIMQQREHQLGMGIVANAQEAIEQFKADTSLDAMLCISGDLSMPAEHVIRLVTGTPDLTLVVHPLPAINWAKVQQGLTMGVDMKPELLGCEYNIPLAKCQPTKDPDVVVVPAEGLQLRSFKISRAVIPNLGKYEGPVHAYLGCTATIFGARDHVGCLAQRATLR